MSLQVLHGLVQCNKTGEESRYLEEGEEGEEMAEGLAAEDLRAVD